MSRALAQSLTVSASEADSQQAKALLIRQRSVDRKSPSGSDTFSYKEVNSVLISVIDANGPPGVVLALLLQHDADVNYRRRRSTGLIKKLLNIDQEDLRSDILPMAIRQSSFEIVGLLAMRADQTTQNEGLQLAIEQKDAAKVKILLKAGADAEMLHGEFQIALEKNAEDIVEALITASKGPCPNCRTVGLIKAVNSGSLRTSSLLLANGADADYDNAAALRTAVLSGRTDIVEAIASCARKPTPESLDFAIEIGYTKLAHNPEKQYNILEICLRGGARGINTDKTLALAAQKGQWQLRDLFIEFGASVNHQGGTALGYAVLSGQPEHLAALLRGEVALENLANAMQTAMELSDCGVICEMTRVLLAAGMQRDPISKALVSALERSTRGDLKSQGYSLIQFLLEEAGADVNFAGGKAIQIAAAEGFIEALKLLLTRKPSAKSLSAAVPQAMRVQDAACKHELISMLLHAGASGRVVNEALVASSTTGKGGVALTLMLLGHSCVDYANGKALCDAIKTGCWEQVETLMTEVPSSETLTAAWIEADALEDTVFQHRVYQRLLDCGIKKSLKDDSLIHAVRKGPRGIDICRLLLEYDASPDHCDGASIVSAARAYDLATLVLLADAVITEKTFAAGIRGILEIDAWTCSEGLKVIQFLLGHGVNQQEEVHLAFCAAARLFSLEALELLENWANLEVAATMAFVEVTGAGKEWLSPDNLPIIDRLIDWGAAGEPVDLALVEAVEALCLGQNLDDLVDTLLGSADINILNGSPVEIAAKYGKVVVLERLLSHETKAKTLSVALAVAITNGHEQKLVLSIIDVILRNQYSKLDAKWVPEGYSSPLFACLQGYPQSVELAKRLCEIGCSLEHTVLFPTYDDEDLPEEEVSVLSWALCQPKKLIASEVIEVLIEAKANPFFTANVSKVTPLILAAKSSRSDIIRRLIKAGAAVPHQDVFERSALFYASQVGDLPSVNALLKAKFCVNDGSLHEASRELHSDVVATLIKSGHQPDFPSSLPEHEGRTPLQEMCLKCDGTDDLLRVKETIQHLINGKASPLLKSREKNALFLALDNLSPVPITRALLDRLMWQHINSEENVYIQTHPSTRKKYYYSPTMYLKLGLSQGPTNHCEKLLQLLIDKRAMDRFYAEKWVEQPENAVGQPPDILDAEEKRQANEEKRLQRELDHQLALIYQRQTAEEKAAIEQARHDEDMFRRDELAQQKQEQSKLQHQQNLSQEQERTMQRHEIQQSTHNLNMALSEQREAQKLSAAQRRAQFDQTQQRRMAEIRRTAQTQEQELRLRFSQQANADRLTMQARQNELSKVASQQKLLTQRRQEQLHADADRRKLAVQTTRNAKNLKFQRGAAQEKYMREKQMMELEARRQNMKKQYAKSKK